MATDLPAPEPCVSWGGPDHARGVLIRPRAVIVSYSAADPPARPTISRNRLRVHFIFESDIAPSSDRYGTSMKSRRLGPPVCESLTADCVGAGEASGVVWRPDTWGLETKAATSRRTPKVVDSPAYSDWVRIC